MTEEIKTKQVKRKKISNKTINSVQLNNERIRFRKWKGKDKKNFIDLIRQNGLDNVSLSRTMEVLVHQALESHKDSIFTQDEYRYLLTRIRQFSLGNEMETELYCDECFSPFTFVYKLTDIIKPIDETLEDYDDGEVFVKFGKIKNRESYLTAVQENKDMDIFYRIEEFNGSKAFSIESLMNDFEELDLDQIEGIIDYFEENKFRIDDVYDVECQHCGHTTPYEFDEIPDFFPQSWFNEAFKDLMKVLNENQTQEDIKRIFGMANKDHEEEYNEDGFEEDFDE